MTPIIVQSDIHLGTFKPAKKDKSLMDRHNPLRFHDTLAFNSDGTRCFSDSTKNEEQTNVVTVLSEAIHKIAPIVFGPKPFDPFDL